VGQREAQTNGLDNVQFLGALPDVGKAALFSLCRAVVFPSHLRSEAFGECGLLEFIHEFTGMLAKQVQPQCAKDQADQHDR